MKASLFFLLMIFLSFSAVVFAQDDNSEKPVCDHPFSSKFNEFEFTDLDSAKEILDLFGLQIKNQNAFGIVIGYGGKITEANQGRLIAGEIETYLTDKYKFTKNVGIVDAWNGGNREKPFVELYIKPQRCSSDPENSPTLTLDEVTYKEEKDFFSKDISMKSIDEMKKLLTSSIEPDYPPSARAVRARGIVFLLITVDEKGNVIKTKTVGGHPLLYKASEEAVKKWKFQTQKENNKPIKFGGKIIIDWDEIAEKWYSENKQLNN